jgi:hypothetical protein
MLATIPRPTRFGVLHTGSSQYQSKLKEHALNAR